MRHIKVEYVKSFEEKSDGVSFTCEASDKREVEFELTVYSDRILRIWFCPDRRLRGESSLIELKRGWNQPKFHLGSDDEEVRLSTREITVKVRRDPWNLQVYNKDGRLICCEATADMDVHALYRSRPIGCYIDSEGRICGVNETITLFPDEHLYGLGEKFTELDKRGRTVTCWNVNPFGSGTEESYKNIPFMVSSRGYGIFLNSTYKSVWKLGSESNMAYTFLTEDKILDYFFIYGPSLKDVLEAYAEITGKPEMSPLWSFGAWFTAYIWDDLGEVEEICEKMRKHEIPCDVMFIEGDFRLWMGDVKERGPLEWNERSAPKLMEIVDTLNRYGIKLMLAESPYVDVESEFFHELSERDFLAKNRYGSTYITNLGLKYVHGLDRVKTGERKGLDTVDEVSRREVKDRLAEDWRQKYLAEFYSPAGIFDFTNPEAVKWWKKMHRVALEAGVKAFFCDFGEDIPTDTHFFNGRDGREMHNIYPLLYHKTTFESLREFGVKGILCNRSGYAGSQKYPIHWSGDPNCSFQDLYWNVRAGLNIGLSGIAYWSHDTGGFSGFPDEELMIRWLQFSIFSSHIRFHGTLPSKVDGPRMPWLYSSKTPKTIRDLLRFRYELTPYIVSYAYEASKNGLPIMRAMVLEFQDDPNTYTMETQYMFGGELLVAPIIERKSSDSRIVYLPEERWVNYWSEKIYSGPQNLTYKSPLERIPLFVKMNSIIPKIPERRNLSAENFSEMMLDCYVQDYARFDLYDFERETTLECFKKGEKMSLKISPSKRSYKVRFHLMERSPREVILNGKVLSEAGDQRELDRRDSAWFFNDTDKLLIVKFSAEGEETLLNVDF